VLVTVYPTVSLSSSSALFQALSPYNNKRKTKKNRKKEINTMSTKKRQLSVKVYIYIPVYANYI